MCDTIWLLVIFSEKFCFEHKLPDFFSQYFYQNQAFFGKNFLEYPETSQGVQKLSRVSEIFYRLSRKVYCRMSIFSKKINALKKCYIWSNCLHSHATTFRITETFRFAMQGGYWGFSDGALFHLAQLIKAKIKLHDIMTKKVQKLKKKQNLLVFHMYCIYI